MRWVALVLLLANGALTAWMVLGQPRISGSSGGPPPEIGHLTLLRESPHAGVGAGVCYTIGPFDEAGRAEDARRRLTELGLDPEQRTTEDRDVYGYQVLLPPYPTRAEALEATRELAEKGVEDYFVINAEAGLENAVSVGLFEQKRYAVRHADYLNDLGFDAELRLRTRNRTRYWQDYRDPEGRVTPELLESLTADGPLQRLERPCG